MTESSDLWFPLFEWTKFLYRSFLVLPSDTDPEGPVALKEWAKGEFSCGQAFQDGDGYTLGGQLIFRPGVELAVNIRGRKGRGTGPGTFEGTGAGKAGVTMGAVYELTGLPPGVAARRFRSCADQQRPRLGQGSARPDHQPGN